MKQTKSALTMLLAHYRAIYKHAILAAFVAASTLGVSSSIAGEWPQNVTEDGVLDINTSVSIDDQTTTTIPDTVTELKVSGGTLNISSGGGATVDLTLKPTKLTIANGGTIELDKAGNKTAVTFKARDVVLGGALTLTNGEVTFDSDGKTQGQLDATGGSITLGNTASLLTFKNIKADLLNLKELNFTAAGEIKIATGALVQLKQADAEKGKITLESGELYVKATDDKGFKLSTTNIVGTAINGTGKLLTDHAVVEAAIGAGANNITLEADKLTLGASGGALDAATGFNVAKGITVKNELVMANAGNKLLDKISLNHVGEGKGKITGAVTVGKSNGDGSIIITSGEWDSDNITVDGQGDDTKLTVNAGTTLTSSGDITVTKGTVEIDGTLNANKINVTAATGKTTVKGTVNVKDITVATGSTITLDDKGSLGDFVTDSAKAPKLNIDGTLALVNNASFDVSKINLDDTNGNKLKTLTVGTANTNNASVTVLASQLNTTGIESQNKINKLTIDGKDKGNIVKIVDESGKLDDLTIASDKLAGVANNNTLALVTGTLQGADLIVTVPTADANTTLTLGAKGNLDFNNAIFDAKDTKNAGIATGTLTVKDTLSVYKVQTTDVQDFEVGDNGALILDKGGSLAENVKVDGKDVKVNGQLDVANIKTKGDITVNDIWNFNNANVDFDAAKKLEVSKDSAIVNGGNLTTTANASTLTIKTSGDATFKTLKLDNATTLNLTGNGTNKLIITGDSNTSVNEKGEGADLALGAKVNINTNGYLAFGADASKDIFSKFDTTSNSVVFTKTGTDLLSKIATDGSSVVEFALDNTYKFTNADINGLKAKFSNKGNDFKGFINLGNAQLADLGEATVEVKGLQDKAYDWKDVDGIAHAQVTNNTLKDALVKVDASKTPANVTGNFGALYVKGEQALTVEGNTVLNNAAKTADGKNEFFISNTDAKGNIVAGSATVANGMTLSLNNGGTIKDVTLSNPNSTLNINNGAKGVTTVNDIIGSDANGKAVLTGGIINVNKINVNEINAKSSVVNAKSVNLGSGNNSVDNATLNAESFNLGAGAKLAIENDGILSIDGSSRSGRLVSTNGTINLGDMLDEDDKDSTDTNGRMFVRNADGFTGTLNLESGTEKASIAVFAGQEKQAKAKDGIATVSTFAMPATTRAATPTMTVNHTAKVGNNSVVAYGFESVDDVVSLLQSVDGMSESGKVSSSLADDIESGGQGLKANPKQGDALAVINMPIVVDETTGELKLNSKYNTTVKAGKVSLGNYSAIVMTEKAFADGKAAISTNGADTVVVEDKANTSGILVGNFTNEIFDGGKTLQVFAKDALTGETLGDKQTFTVETVNGLLTAVVGRDGAIKGFTLNEEEWKSGESLRYASTPVREYIKDIMLNDATKLHTIKTVLKETNNLAEPNTKEKPLELTEAEMKTFKATNEFINSLANSLDGGKGFEQSARFAVYGGVVKGAELAAKAGYEAVQGYAENTIAAATVQNEMGSFFVVPTYKSSDSDSFNAEGLDFGSDVSLSGVALGADFVVAPAIKLGAMFNIGTGDAKGQGAASGVDSDLDYVGVGLFARYEENGINVVADLSYTKSGSDITATIKDNQVKADLDTKVLSLGVKGSYKFDLDGTYAKPYAGIRFSKYDLDDYTLSAQGLNYMTGSYDDMTVVSVPVGVQLGTDIMAGDWSLTPSLDLGVTFNLGDTDLSHSAQAVTKTEGMKLTSEVIDDVVFGIKGGLKANYQALSLGLGLGYEMGSNSDDLSVQGTVKYTF